MLTLIGGGMDAAGVPRSGFGYPVMPHTQSLRIQTIAVGGKRVKAHKGGWRKENVRERVIAPNSRRTPPGTSGRRRNMQIFTFCKAHRPDRTG